MLGSLRSYCFDLAHKQRKSELIDRLVTYGGIMPFFCGSIVFLYALTNFWIAMIAHSSVCFLFFVVCYLSQFHYLCMLPWAIVPQDSSILYLFHLISSLDLFFRLLTSTIRREPDFLIVGFPKCGTTSFASALMNHEAFISARDKETYFASGLVGPKLSKISWLYRSMFPVAPKFLDGVRGARRLAFDSPVVSSCIPWYPKLLHALAPKAKLIFLIRDPIEREISARRYFQTIRMLGGPDYKNFSKALESSLLASGTTNEIKALANMSLSSPIPIEILELIWGSGWHSIPLDYCQVIEEYLKYFQARDMLVVNMRALRKDPEAVNRELGQFFEIESVLSDHPLQFPEENVGSKRQKDFPEEFESLIYERCKTSMTNLDALLEEKKIKTVK